MNIRSIKNKMSELSAIINSYKHTIHVIVISETWLHDNETQFYNIQQYEAFHNTRPTTAGGVSIFIHNSLKGNIIYNDTTDYNNILGIEIKYTNQKMHIFGIYKQPQSNTIHFLTHLEATLNTFKNSIYIGDFNINILKNNNEVRQYMETVVSNGHIILNKIDQIHATRLNKTDGGTIIDHVITDNIKSTYSLSLYDTPITDHRYMHITINKYKHQQIKINETKTIT